MKIIAAVDFSDITKNVLTQAKQFAKALPSEVCLIHVAIPDPDSISYGVDPAGMYAIDPTEMRASLAQGLHKDHQQLQQYADELRNEGIECKALMIQGPTVEVLLNEAEKQATDFFVVGSHGKGIISQVILGSVSEDLIKKSKIPVHVVPSTE